MNAKVMVNVVNLTFIFSITMLGQIGLKEINFLFPLTYISVNFGGLFFCTIYIYIVSCSSFCQNYFRKFIVLLQKREPVELIYRASR